MTVPTGHWLLITTRGNWDRLRDRKVWVFGEKDAARAAGVGEGDEALVYVTQEGGQHQSGICGLVKFVGPLEETPNPRAFDALYPYSRGIRVLLSPGTPLPFKPLKSNVTFVSQGSNRGAALQGQPLKQIPARDFAFLKEQLDHHVRQEATA